MNSIFDYLDYRKFLEAYYEHHKAHTKGFSYRSFLQAAEISSPSFLKQVIDGKRKLTPATTTKFLKALQLSQSEGDYFCKLVTFTHTLLNEDKQQVYREMRAIARSQDLKLIGEECYDYYEHWYISALRELLTLHDFRDNWRDIGRSLQPQISAQQAKEATETLLRLGFLQQDESGAYQQTNPTITSGVDVESMSIRNFNTQCLDLAGQAIRQLHKDQRHVTGVTMGCSQEAYLQITEEIEVLQNKILAILKEDTAQDRVLQFNTMLYPLGQFSTGDHPSTRDEEGHP